MKLAVATFLFISVLFPQSTFALTSSQLGNSSKNIDIIPHRGASGHAPEHTIFAYELGLSMGGDYIEMDIHLTKDSQLVIFHDDKIDRTTNGAGLINTILLKDLKKLDAGSWFNFAYPERSCLCFIGLEPPTLDEVIEHFGNSSSYFIEIKSPGLYQGIEEKLLAVLSNHNLLEANKNQVILQSFNRKSLQKIHKLNPNIRLVQLVNKNLTEKEMNQIKKYAVGVGIDYKKLNQNQVSSLMKKNLKVYTYTVNEQEEMKKLIEWGVSGIFTDYPNKLNEIIH